MKQIVGYILLGIVVPFAGGAIGAIAFLPVASLLSKTRGGRLRFAYWQDFLQGVGTAAIAVIVMRLFSIAPSVFVPGVSMILPVVYYFQSFSILRFTYFAGFILSWVVYASLCKS